MRTHRRATGAATGVVSAALLVTGTVLLPATAGAQPSEHAVIAEVYGGGGNSGATLTTDFVELANRGSAAVDLAGWSVQYLPANPSATSQWQLTTLAGSVQPDGRYLVAHARGNGGSVELPAPDATGSIAMAATAGTIALVNGTEQLTCKTAGDCAADTSIVDLVGYGGAVVREGGPAPAASNTTSVARADVLADTDDNGADFTAGEPSPTNAAGQGPDPDPEPGEARIRDIQGTTRLSPLAGDSVAGVPGVVTAIRQFGSARGFWFTDPEPDGDQRTSEGLFVFTGSSTPDVAVGDEVLVAGRVAEFYSGGASSPNQSITELTGASWTVLSAGNELPPAELVGPDTIPADWTPDAGGGNIEALELRPDEFALDFFESREGMVLRIEDARVVGATNAFNELWVTTKPDQNPTPRGGTLYRSYGDSNAGRIKVESLIPFSERPFPVADVGDLLAGGTEGPVDYESFGGYMLQATTLGELVDGGLEHEVTRAQRPHELAVATYNLENLGGADDQAKYDRLAAGIVTNLASPDIVGLEEIQDNNGPTNDGTVAADVTLDRLVDAVEAAGGPRYEWRQIDPVNLADGGQPGGNIRVGFLFNPQRVSFVDRPGGDATTPVQVERNRGRAALSVSPGRIDPANPAWDDSRKPLAGEFVFRGRTVFVAVNHFSSKGGDQPLHGRFQPPNRGSEIARLQQAAAVRGFVDDVARIDRNASVLVVGDINDFQFSPVVRTLTEGGALRTLIDQLPAGEQYSYVFDGNSQVLDQILASPAVRSAEYDIVHINAEFADQASDHDPSVVRFVPRGAAGGGPGSGDPGPGGEPAPPAPGAGGDDLANTGVSGVVPLAVGGALLLAAGAAALVAARRGRAVAE